MVVALLALFMQCVLCSCSLSWTKIRSNEYYYEYYLLNFYFKNIYNKSYSHFIIFIFILENWDYVIVYVSELFDKFMQKGKGIRKVLMNKYHTKHWFLMYLVSSLIFNAWDLNIKNESNQMLKNIIKAEKDLTLKHHLDEENTQGFHQLSQNYKMWAKNTNEYSVLNIKSLCLQTSTMLFTPINVYNIKVKVHPELLSKGRAHRLRFRGPQSVWLAV